VNSGVLTRKVGDIPNEPDKKESKGDAISTPRFVIKNKLWNLSRISTPFIETYILNGTPQPLLGTYQEENPCCKTDAAKDPR
jgi:hypothetical protein